MHYSKILPGLFPALLKRRDGLQSGTHIFPLVSLLSQISEGIPFQVPREPEDPQKNLILEAAFLARKSRKLRHKLTSYVGYIRPRTKKHLTQKKTFSHLLFAAAVSFQRMGAELLW